MRKILEKLKNKKVLALYLVGVLLLSTGLSYAFFTATSSISGSGSISSVDTATISSEGIAGDGNISFSEADIYPGHTAIASIKVTGTGENTPLLYNVIFEGTNTFTTPINYTIYKVDSNIDVSYSCTPKTGVVDGAMMYYEECSGNNITSLGSPIKSGIISNGKTTLLDNEVIITTPEGTITYYYVVIEYPNQDNEQNADIGSTLSGTIKVESNGEYPKPEVLFVGNTTEGSNGWYKSASITSNITSYTDDYEVEYCTTTSDTCTPDTSPTLSNNSFTINLDNNSSEQRVCVRITDSYNQTGEGCSLGYKIDGENPTVTIASEEVDKTSIKVTVNGSDSYSGITQYKFSKDNGSNYETINTSEDTYTYTFNNLESGTAYNIKVQVIDNAGNIGEISKEISTQADITANEYILASVNRPTASATDWTGGTSYYYTGEPNNWVQFAGFYWRIIRINGDGSIRMIYSGSDATGPATSGIDTQIGTSAFNNSDNNKTHVGLVYDESKQHGYGTNSTILGTNDSVDMTTLNGWYNTYMKSYENYIDTGAGFCSDRNLASGDNWNDSDFYYAPFERRTGTGTLQCNSEDVLSKDNGKLANPIGLITSDEYILSGKRSSYLNTGAYYWTMSPSRLHGGYALVLFIYYGDNPDTGWASSTYGVRPVINLRADVQLTGSGMVSDPFKVVGAS